MEVILPLKCKQNDQILPVVHLSNVSVEVSLGARKFAFNSPHLPYLTHPKIWRNRGTKEDFLQTVKQILNVFCILMLAIVNGLLKKENIPKSLSFFVHSLWLVTSVTSWVRPPIFRFACPSHLQHIIWHLLVFWPCLQFICIVKHWRLEIKIHYFHN